MLDGVERPGGEEPAFEKANEALDLPFFLGTIRCAEARLHMQVSGQVE
jgi:hypothetical protein